MLGMSSSPVFLSQVAELYQTSPGEENQQTSNTHRWPGESPSLVDPLYLVYFLFFLIADTFDVIHL